MDEQQLPPLPEPDGYILDGAPGSMRFQREPLTERQSLVCSSAPVYRHSKLHAYALTALKGHTLKISAAITNAGFTLVRTQSGYEVRRFEQLVAQGGPTQSQQVTGQCCEKASGPGAVCAECAAASAGYSADMKPVRTEAQAQDQTAGTSAALEAAVSALYFDDGSDFKSALHAVVRALNPAIADTLQRDPKLAYDQATGHTSAPARAGCGALADGEVAAIHQADELLHAAGLKSYTQVFSSRARLLCSSRDLLAAAGGDWAPKLLPAAQALQTETAQADGTADAPRATNPLPVHMSGVAHRKAAALAQEGYKIVGYAFEKPGARSAVMFDAAVRWLNSEQRAELMFSDVEINNAFGQWLVQTVPAGTVILDPATWGPQVIEAYRQAMDNDDVPGQVREAPRG